MVEFYVLIANLGELNPEVVYLVVQRRSTYLLLRVVKPKLYVSLFKHNGKLQINIVHEYLCYSHRVNITLEYESPMYNVARVYCFERISAIHFEI